MRFLRLTIIIFVVFVGLLSGVLFAQHEDEFRLLSFSTTHGDTFFIDTTTGELLSHQFEGYVNPVWSPDGNWLLLANAGQFPGGLNIVNPFQGTPYSISPSGYPYQEETPRISPNGEWILFTAWGGYVTYGDGYTSSHCGGTHLLAPYSYRVSADWSPDGQWLAFIYEGQLYRLKAGSDNPVNLATHVPYSDISLPPEAQQLTDDVDIQAAYVSWSPDGQWIVFTSAKPDKSVYHVTGDMYRIHPNGDGLEKYTHLEDVNREQVPLWSPDSQKITFLLDYSLYVMNVDGSGLIHLTPEIERVIPLAWTADGEWIIFVDGWEEGGADTDNIYRVRSDGSKLQALTHGQFDFLFDNFTISPDIEWIAFTTDTGTKLYRMRTDGSELKLLLDIRDNWSPGEYPAAINFISWQP